MHPYLPAALKNLLHTPGESEYSRDWGLGTMDNRAGASVHSVVNPWCSEGLE